MGLFLILIVVVVGIFSPVRSQSESDNSSVSCDPNDSRALQSFMASLHNRPDNWDITNSSSLRCCEWEGVSCDEQGRVSKLELPRKCLSGELSESVGSLDHLRTLNLSNNFLTSTLPVSLFNLSKLRVLDLSFNQFYGPVPDLFNLSSIRELDFSKNYLNGSLPGRSCSWGSSELKVLKLGVNYFTGEVPSGFGNCGSLAHLDLQMNELSDLSEGLYRLQKLSTLILANNMLSGPLSQGIGNLTNLVRLDISRNGFTGTIPNVFSMLGKLESFIAHPNNFTGNIPDSLTNSPVINLLKLRNNSLKGVINLNCSAMVSLTSLDLATNLFNGTIPDNLPYCRHLNSVSLDRNPFTGGIPKSFINFQSLSYFALSNTTNTNLSSALRILQQCQNLTTLVMSLNFHDDTLPSDQDIHFPRLKILVIANCRLTGSIPNWLAKSERLQLLDLSWNRLVGTIPGWFGDFQDLFYLDISNNSFVGEIPKSLTQLPSLIDRDISIQEPSPDFPFFMKRNISARGLRYNKLRSFPPTLDLSCNHLTGPIWPEFGNLRRLHVLDLKLNNLSGPIPSSLSGLSSLENMDLSHNNLAGTIPSSLIRLSFMSVFNVAYNKLRGRVPTGGQFLTFPSSSFEGNDLCGDQLKKPCQSTEDVGDANVESATGGGRDYVLLSSSAIGVVLGLALGTKLFEVSSRKSLVLMKLLLKFKIRD